MNKLNEQLRNAANQTPVSEKNREIMMQADDKIDATAHVRAVASNAQQIVVNYGDAP